MTPEESARLGVSILFTVIVASGIAWYTIFRFLRWVLM
jgi:hypothetical protein